jgi:hypothetical protein
MRSHPILGVTTADPAVPEDHSSIELSPRRACGIPLAFTLALAAFVLLPQVRHQPRLMWSFAAASSA